MMLPVAPDPATTARQVARMLLEIGAVRFDPANPVTWSNGLRAPSYIDCRKLLGFPRIRAAVADWLAARVVAELGYESLDVVAGGETAGIPFAALVAERLALPMAYVRKKPKGHGRMARIEGRLEPGDRVLLVEDLATDGSSKLSFVEAIRAAGGRCESTAVVFYYKIFPEAEARLRDAGLRLLYLCSFWEVLAEARALAAFDERTLAQVEAFLAAPHGWTAPG